MIGDSHFTSEINAFIKYLQIQILHDITMHYLKSVQSPLPDGPNPCTSWYGKYNMLSNKASLQGTRKHIPPNGKFGRSSTQKCRLKRGHVCSQEGFYPSTSHHGCFHPAAPLILRWHVLSWGQWHPHHCRVPKEWRSLGILGTNVQHLKN